MPAEVPVTFDPPGVTVRVAPGTRLLDAAREARIELPATCGGRGVCGDCAVEVLAGALEPPTAFEQATLGGARAGVRLACMARVSGPLTVRPLGAPPAGAAAAPTGGTARTAAAPPGGLVAAVDLGTTTITARLMSAIDGRSWGEAAVSNPQRRFGGDVASRLSAALGGHAGELRELAAEGIGAALRAAGAREGRDLSRIVIAGNTVMAHLALGAEVGTLAVHPYVPTVTGTVRGPADVLPKIPWPKATVVILPSLDAFVGADVTAGVLATDLDEPAAGTRVLVDLGTNAEVVVAAGGALTVASAAAGPAFEAAGLACGGPALPGAIRWAAIEPDGALALSVVGGGEARTLCGSGALSLVAALLASGHLDRTGRMQEAGPLAARFHERGGVLALQVSGERGGERDVHLTQRDVRELQLAKAAVATALSMTLEAAGSDWAEVEEVLVAGAFGSGVDGALLEALGVVPAGLAARVEPVGDAALTGAALVALDPAAEARAERVAASVRGLELAADPAFQRAFLARLDFPQTR